MKRKRPRGAKAQPPRRAPVRTLAATSPKALHYKVVELSTVDEGALERTLNEWVAKGWNFENVQFAMRESSKRPAMAFVFFTREGEPATQDLDEARARLVRLAEAPSTSDTALPMPSSNPYERLKQLAGEGDGPEEEGLTLEPDE